MQIEELSKSQIVLLTLLVSFVTSIATGIVTVSLMQQAPPAIMQSVSRVIQETVQTVAPAKGSQPAATVVTQEKTVVVNESDLVAKAVARVSPSLVRLYTDNADTPLFLGLGVVVDGNGTVAADGGALGDSADATAVLQDGTSARMFVRKRDDATGIAYLTPATSTSAVAPHWISAGISTGQAALGQSVVALAGKAIPRIASGLVTALVPLGTASSSPEVIETDIGADSIMPGSAIVSTEGTLLGISTALARGSSASGFISVGGLVQQILPH